MPEEYRYREIRKGERQAVLAFATGHGCHLKKGELSHHLSLAVEKGDRLVAAALCVSEGSEQFVIELVADEAEIDQDHIAELADRCLRKVQAEDIGAARLHSANEGPENMLWSSANWLDQIEETAPPDAKLPADESPQAA